MNLQDKMITLLISCPDRPGIVASVSHYVTDDLDEGPIISQDVIQCNHRDTIKDLVRKGRDVERRVLAEAVRLHVEDRVLVYGNKTIVF